MGIAVVAAAGLVAGCGEDEPDRPGSGRVETAAAPSGPARQAVDVRISDFRFVPVRVKLARGGKVTWSNADRAPHTAENDGIEGAPAPFGTGRLEKGDRRTITFSEPGSYTYYCVFHRFMEANVVVE